MSATRFGWCLLSGAAVCSGVLIGDVVRLALAGQARLAARARSSFLGCSSRRGGTRAVLRGGRRDRRRNSRDSLRGSLRSSSLHLRLHLRLRLRLHHRHRSLPSLRLLRHRHWSLRLRLRLRCGHRRLCGCRGCHRRQLLLLRGRQRRLALRHGVGSSVPPVRTLIPRGLRRYCRGRHRCVVQRNGVGVGERLRRRRVGPVRGRERPGVGWRWRGGRRLGARLLVDRRLLLGPRRPRPVGRGGRRGLAQRAGGAGGERAAG
jgi:hypothetical protein